MRRTSSRAFPRYRPVGDSALSVELGECLNEVTSRRAASLALALEADLPLGVHGATPTLAAVLVRYDPKLTSHRQVVSAVERHSVASSQARPTRRVTVPTHYGGELGEDLDEVASRTGMEPDDVIRLHSSVDYSVHMIGFLPGFAYLGTLPVALQLPRRANPRIRVPARSVAIAAAMTAVYPVASPGGWHLLGTTPLDMFDPMREPPVLLHPGDVVRFEAVDRSRYEDLCVAWRAGVWAPVIDER